MKRTLLAAAFLSMSAFGATVSQKADMKFAFTTPSGEHAAGTYNLNIRENAATGALIELRSAETGKAVMFYPLSTLTTYKRGQAPRMVFKCTDAKCSLAEIWTSSQGYAIRQRKQTPDEAAKLAITVPVTAAAAE